MSLEQARKFWAFQSLQAVAPPQDTTDYWSRTSLDAFIHAELKKHELHLLGIDHESLTFRHSGRDFRLTDVHGRVVREIIS